MSKQSSTKEDDSKPAPKEIKTEAPPPPPFTVPLKELDVGKAGVSDLFNKQNEVIRYLNALTSKPKAP